MSSNSNRAEDVAQLVSMGFETTSVNQALTAAQGNVEQALNWLLSGEPIPTTTTNVAANTTDSATPTDVRMGTTHQYAMEGGRSACTCIALTTANALLQASGTASLDQHLTRAFLDQMVRHGVEHQNATAATSASVEHSSVEDWLGNNNNNAGAFSSIDPAATTATVRQGILSHDPHHAMGLSAILQSIGSSSSSLQCIVMTKPPETILILLEKDESSSSTSCWIVDSHPRPTLHGSEAAVSAQRFESISSLCRAIHQPHLFPPTTQDTLGPDVPDLMVDMYNSFDTYLIVPSTITPAATTATY